MLIGQGHAPVGQASRVGGAAAVRVGARRAAERPGHGPGAVQRRGDVGEGHAADGLGRHAGGIGSQRQAASTPKVRPEPGALPPGRVRPARALRTGHRERLRRRSAAAGGGAGPVGGELLGGERAGSR